MVLAGPGTGKTLVVTHRLMYLMNNGYKPEETVAITFTQRAAQEMLQRLRQLGLKETPLFIGTIHSLGRTLLRQAGITHAVADRQYCLDVLRECYRGDNYREVYDEMIMKRSALAEMGEEIQEIYHCYERLLRERGYLDFEHLLEIPIHMIRAGQIVLSEIREVVVDEFQDVSPLEYEFIKAICSGGARAFVVGDDDQSIYSFRGSAPKVLRRFLEEFQAELVVLEENFRNPSPVYSIASAVVDGIPDRLPKRLKIRNPLKKKVLLVRQPDESTEAAFIASEIKKRLGGTGYHDLSNNRHRCLGDFGILVRIHALAGPIEDALRRAGIPFRSVKMRSPLEYEPVIKALHYLNFIITGEETSLVEIINTPARGIGEASLRRFLQEASARDISLYTLLKEKARQQQSLRQFIETTEQLRSSVMDIHTLLSEVLRCYGLLDHYCPEGVDEPLQYLITLARACRSLPPEIGLLQVKDELSLSRGDDLTAGLPESESVTIMSMHSAKGLQFPVVFIAGLEDGIIPLRLEGKEADEEEERRLLYVAMTRAEEELVLTYADHRLLYGKRRHQSLCPFINLEDQNIEVYQQRKRRQVQGRLF